MEKRQDIFDVFISYSHADKTVADGICANLEANGIRCWYAPRDIRPGDDWADAIMRAIGEAACFVLIFSGKSNQSGQVKNEVTAAFNAGCMIIPFKIEDAPMQGALSYYLTPVHWIDAVDAPLLERITLLYEHISDYLKKGRKPFQPVPLDEPVSDDSKREEPVLPDEPVSGNLKREKPVPSDEQEPGNPGGEPLRPLVKRRPVKIAAAIFAAVLLVIALSFGIRYFYTGNSGAGSGYTSEENAAIETSVSMLTTNLGVFAAQVNAQQEILDTAQTNAVLSGDETREENLKEQIDSALAYLQTYYIQSLDEEDYAILSAAGLPAEEIRSALVLPVDMQNVMEESLETLSIALCGSAENEKGYYTDYDARLGLADAYAAYLDAYIEYAFYESVYVIMVLTPEDTSFETIKELEIFSSLYRSGVSGGISAAETEDILRAAEDASESLEKAYTKMQSAGF